MATGDGRPFFAEGFHADGFFAPEFFGEEPPPASDSVNPFGDVRRGSFGPLGTRIRRAAVWLALALYLVG